MPAFPKQECSLDQAYSTSAELFDAALTGAGLRNQDVAYLLGVSESLVRKWRSRDARVCPSDVQMLQLGLSFLWHRNKALNKRFGFGRLALTELLDAAGALAVAIK
jgi:hypothetical protein